MALIIDDGEFNELPRVCNTNLPGKVRVAYALTRIRGVGRRLAMLVCKKAGIDLSRKAGSLDAEEIESINDVIRNPEKYRIPHWFLNRRYDRASGKNLHVVSHHLVATLRIDIERLKKVQCERGFRHDRGLKLRGQHTKTTGRKGRTLGVSKKKK